MSIIFFQVVFSDETIIYVEDESPQYVRRSPGEAFKKECIVQHVKYPTKVMIWGAISVYGPGKIHVVEGNMNSAQYKEVIRDCLVPTLNEWFPSGDGIFMHDGAPCHRSKTVSAELASLDIPVLQWPGNSPDMNPIESLWNVLKTKVKARKPTTKAQLIEHTLSIWREDEELAILCRTLVEGMPRRIEALIAAKGGHTKY